MILQKKHLNSPTIIRKLLLLFLCLPLLGAQAQSSSDGELKTLSIKYINQLEEATTSLLETRDSILTERAPLANSIQELQDQLIEVKAELQEWRLRIKNNEQEVAEYKTRIDSLKKNINYIRLLSEEAHSSTESSLLPGEGTFFEDDIKSIQLLRLHRDLKQTPEINAKTLELELKRIEYALGGFQHPGATIENSTNQVIEGTILHLGPASYFASEDRKNTGVIRSVDGSVMPHLFPLSGFGSRDASSVLNGEETSIPIDVTGGKALKMENAKGTIPEHIQKGGIVAYVILGLGAFGFLTGLLKLWDFRELSVDSPKTFYPKLSQLQRADMDSGNSRFASFQKSVAELVSIGMRHANRRRDLIDEMLYAYVLLQRNHHEKRLPLLRVVAASAPLLGLLGTVVGMIKTFTLITVFGTGNAAKLSSGISEALVTTELGLIVAIPTVIIFGYLSHQTETRLSLLEQYSTDLSNAIDALKVSKTSATD